MWKGTWVETIHINCPYGQPGDLLWVRESFIEFPAGTYNFKTEPDPVFEQAKTPWKPSIHMPRAAARIWLEIEKVKGERLQDISEEDAIDEGIAGEKGKVSGLIWYKKYITERECRIEGLFTQSAIECYMSLWEKINGHESWNSNPWVWVVKFQVLSTTGKPQICYKTDEICKYDCKGLCRESM